MTFDTAYHGPLGEEFAAHSEQSSWNAYIDRPAMLELAGDVTGQRVLDIGCGPGHYAAALIERGAEVVGVDGSEVLLAHARKRLGEGVELLRHDLEAPLHFASDASFDAIVCALVYHHIHDRKQLLAEFLRVLRPGGRLLLSTTHPSADWRWAGGSYFSQDWIDLPSASGKLSIHYQRMTVESLLGEFLGAGFVLERLVEPQPSKALREVDPAAFDKLNQKPSLLALRLRRT
ncbi:class I SAM-dependent methyltransferase [Glycomyces buryatensis]|uniref:Methyltransferase domain-containing protein n=1 Tax=Glycomyces buryatensis TaxID=2570927 RepID=A0A4S8QHJ2_9ACTN|nr:class I SAM-dependent methyltransferase [Glycomyces buryatensis]THV40154.1 methyltransferase domain-containing protein [Glycomyces buryatensis]